MYKFRNIFSKRLTEIQKKCTYQQFIGVRRFFRLCATRQCSPKQNGPTADKLLESWYYEVNPFGFLKIKMPFNIQVKSLNPETHTEMNRVIVQIVSNAGSNADETVNLPLMYDLKTQVNKTANEIEVTANVQKGVTLPIECIVQAPIKMSKLWTHARTNTNTFIYLTNW